MSKSESGNGNRLVVENKSESGSVNSVNQTTEVFGVIPLMQSISTGGLKKPNGSVSIHPSVQDSEENLI